MPNRGRGLKTEVVPAWQAFIAEALPAGSVTRAAAAVNSAGGPLPQPYANTSPAAFLRRIANGGVGQPEASTVWYAAEAARELEQGAWCAGPLFLFAAGHFERFAAVVLSANPRLVAIDRKRQLVEVAGRACEPTKVVDLEGTLRQVGVAETVIRTQLRRSRPRAVNPPVRPERNVWILTETEEAAFQHAFVENSEPGEAAFVAARLVALHPEIRLSAQRDIVCTMLSAALMRAPETP